VLAALYHDVMILAEVIAKSSHCRSSPAHHRSRASGAGAGSRSSPPRKTIRT
jgi:hypothetical protein